MKKFIVIATLFLVGKVSAQEETITLTLSQAIEIAQKNSPQAESARHTYRSAYWAYRSYKADYLPSVTLSSSPYFNRQISKITQGDGTDIFRERNQLGVDLQLDITQNIWFTGGSLFVQTSAQRMDELRNKVTSHSTQPISIGYRQSLFGYNSYKWDRRLEPLIFRQARKTYNEALELVSSQASSYFFSLANAQTSLEIAEYNYASADTLYRYAQGRYNIGTITESDMLQLEINKLSEETNLMNARIEVEEQMQKFRSFLGFTNDVPLKVIPENKIPNFKIPLAEALQMAFENSPDPEYYKRMKIQSQSNLASARANAGLKADIYLKFGLSQTGETLSDAYRDPINQQYVTLNLSLPILDWGRGKGRIRVAKSNVELTKIQVEQNLKNFELNVIQLVHQFNMQNQYVEIASKRAHTADRRHEVAKRQYILGKSTILDLNSSITERDSAHRNYISALSRYWSLYYTIRSMTGYDFEKNQKIEENLPEI